MGNIRSLEHTYAATAPVAADMTIKTSAMWTCTVVFVLLLESSCAHKKLNVHWGPQSMMYLKGKHGRRFVSEGDSGVVKQGLQVWYVVLRGIQRLQLLEFSKPSYKPHRELRQNSYSLPQPQMSHSLHMRTKVKIH